MLRLWLLLFSVVIAARAAHGEEAVHFPSRDGIMLNARLYVPSSSNARHPAVVLLHGCAGLGRSDGTLFSRHRDWAKRLGDAGFVVVLPDSFGSRGLPSQCAEKKRSINPAGRAADAFGALGYLLARKDVDPKRIAVMGWSNGGSTTLHVAGTAPRGPAFARAIAFYPGCRPLLDKRWNAHVPTSILHGADDDWTPIKPCEDLARSGGRVTLDAFAGAHHGFDAPDTPVRQRRGVAFSANGDGTVTTGTHEASRQRAIRIVMDLLAGLR